MGDRETCALDRYGVLRERHLIETYVTLGTRRASRTGFRLGSVSLGRAEIRPRAFKFDCGANSRDSTFNSHNLSRVFHPFFSLQREHNVDIQLRALRWGFWKEEQRACGAYIAKHAGLDEAASAIYGAFNAYLPIHLKTLRSSAFDQRASNILRQIVRLT